MDGNLVDSLLFVQTTGTLNGILGSNNLRWFRVFSDERNFLAIGSRLQVKQHVGTNTINPSSLNLLITSRFVLEDDTGNVDRVGVKFRAGRNGVVTRLQTRDRRNDNVERNGPGRSVLLGGNGVDIVTSSQLKNFTELETAVVDNVIVLFLV